MSLREHHDAWVAAWIAHAAKDLRPVQRLALFDQAFAALWQRAHPMLGELTLSAVVGRTLREAAETHPVLASLELESGGISFREVRGGAAGTGDPELSEALRFLLAELLAALGKLTGETLTPLLHRALAKCAATPEGVEGLEPEPQRP